MKATPSSDSRHRLRTRRVNAASLGLPGLGITARHPTIGALVGELLDLGKYGLAASFSLGEHEGRLLLPGDRLEPLWLTRDGEVIFSGPAVLRRAETRGDQIQLGLELESDWFEIAGLHRLAAKLGFASRWERAEFEARHGDLAPAFKSWVIDLRAYLEETAHFLDGEERGLLSLDRASRERHQDDYLALAAPRIQDRMRRAEEELRDLVGGLADEAHESHRHFFRHHLTPYLRRSPFLQRALDKPLGYAGDYEMMNMLYRDHQEGDSIFGKALNLYATQAPVAQANINRIEYMVRAVRDLASRHPVGRLRVISVGCGPAQEIRTLLEQHPELGPRLDVSLIDQGEDAIRFCEQSLSPLMARTGAKGHFSRDDIRRYLTLKDSAGYFGAAHLIFSSGLFDYLSARAYRAFGARLHSSLHQGGEMILGNVATNNPSRWAMEYLCDWFVIHRAPEELTRLAGMFAPESRAWTEAEPSGVNLFLRVRKES